MNERQKAILLFVIDCIERIPGRIFLQKLFFIIEKEVIAKEKKESIFSFEPYHYGPYSRELNGATSDLVDEGLITERKIGDYYEYAFTNKTNQELKKFAGLLSSQEKKLLIAICNTVKKFTPKDMLNYVYNHYPETTVNSLLKR